MTDINHVAIIGRLTRAPGGLAYTVGGTARLDLSIAVNRSEKRNGAWADKASYFDVTVWGKTAENIKPYIGKGKQIAVAGYLDQQRWEKNGQKHSKVCIIANQVQLLGGKTAETQQPAQGYVESDDGFSDDIPF